MRDDHGRYQLSLVIALGSVLLLAGCAAGPGGGGQISSERLAAIRTRHQLICGIDGQTPGFSSPDSQGHYRGFEVDVCQAVAAAVLGDPRQVSYQPVTLDSRFTAVASGQIDLLARTTTDTLSRDAPGGNALSFAPVDFHDGVDVMVPVASGITDLAGLRDRSVCLLSGATTEQVLGDALRPLGVTYKPLRFGQIQEAFAAYRAGRCQAVSIDSSILAAQRSAFADPASHRLLGKALSKEPQAPATQQADPAWADAVRWIVYALFEAEEQGITQANVKAKLAEAKANPKLAERRRLLGVEGNLGSQLGLSDDFVVQVISAVGNYGEIYNRHLGEGSALGLPRGANRLAGEGGLMVSPPFR